ncbi:uncharacterized protein K02A2.6-like [Anneissia japonica]|uniref:uncharacterized protein K02A2.6-like n=1 Tax=Anneissia japonica TaxID=1529436 RepID=UPI0014258006|nr:uncharacterized protein K02A2.6-like [Anneissia japonica]
MVVIDDYSRFPVIEVTKSTSAKSVIPKLDTIFATYGIPVTVRTDNGPPFNGGEFSQFAQYSGFKHRKVTPLWPRANGEVERMMRNLKKLYRTATAEQQNWRQALNKYLRNHRATPHSSTGMPPATLMFGREIRTRLPEIPRSSTNDKTLRLHDKKAKSTMKLNAERNKPFKNKTFHEGDVVLRKRDGSLRSHETPYHTQPYTVTKVNGTMISAYNGNHTITRNSSFFKKADRLKSKSYNQQLQLDSDYDDEPTPAPQFAPAPQTPDRQRPKRSIRLPSRLKDYVM